MPTLPRVPIAIHRSGSSTCFSCMTLFHCIELTGSSCYFIIYRGSSVSSRICIAWNLNYSRTPPRKFQAISIGFFEPATPILPLNPLRIAIMMLEQYQSKFPKIIVFSLYFLHLNWYSNFMYRGLKEKRRRRRRN